MELGLSLGLNINTTLSIGPNLSNKSCDHRHHQEEEEAEAEEAAVKKENHSTVTHQDHEATNKLFPIVSLSPKADHKINNNTLQLDLLPLSSFPWPPPENGDDVAASSRGLKMSGLPAAEEEESEERAGLSSSPNSGTSSFPMDLSIYSRRGERGSSMSMSASGNNNNINGGEASYYDHQRASSRASDEDDNVGGGSTRKKLRLSKEQSAFLEESFKEHSTLNPKQKLALAKQLNLRPRQVEVWFQNRRARTKLKQTEVDCEYLKRCCETLSEENKRLQKELQELRALKASTSNPFFMQLPATTLTMCPSCERVTPNNPNPSSSSSTPPSAAAGGGAGGAVASKPIGFPFGKPKFYPFAHSKPHQ